MVSMSGERLPEVLSGGELRVVLATHPRDGARELARRVVELRLAACANLLEATSIYRWRGEVESEPETLIVLKTIAEQLPGLLAFLEQHHPYEVPEFVVLPVEGVSAPYRAWLLGSTGVSEAEP